MCTNVINKEALMKDTPFLRHFLSRKTSQVNSMKYFLIYAISLEDQSF